MDLRARPRLGAAHRSRALRQHAARHGGPDRADARTGRRCPTTTRWEVDAAHGGVPPEQLPARRAGRADGRGAAGQRRAAHRRQVLRRHADHGRGAPRRGVRAVHQEARRGAADRAAGEAGARRDPADRRLAEEAGRHADRRRGAGALQLPRDAQPHRGAAAQGPAHLRGARRVAPPRLRRPVRRALRSLPERRASAPSSRTSPSRRRAR